MRICILARYPPLTGGIPVHSQMLVQGLKKRGHDVTVVTYGKFERRLKGVKLYEIPLVNIFFLRGLVYFIGSLIALAKVRNKVDLIHAHPLHPAGTAAVLFKLFSSVPVVVTSHGSDLLKWAKIPLVGRLFSAIANSSDRLICVSKFLAKKATEIGVKADRIAVVYNGIEIPQSVKVMKKGRIKNNLGLPKERKVVLFVGPLKKEKGPSVLLSCAKKIDADFIFIGEGPLRHEFEAFIEKHKLKNVVLLGTKDHETTLRFIKAADVLVVPSEYEGFGLVALEGMALETSVLARPVAALKEIFPAGLLFTNIEKKLVEILKSKKLRHVIVKKSKHATKMFTAKRMVDEIEKIYEEILSVKA